MLESIWLPHLCFIEFSTQELYSFHRFSFAVLLGALGAHLLAIFKFHRQHFLDRLPLFYGQSA
jgi:hypothetical protein